MVRHCSRCHSQLRLSDIFCPYCSAGQGIAQSSPGNPFTGFLMIVGTVLLVLLFMCACSLSLLWLF